MKNFFTIFLKSLLFLLLGSITVVEAGAQSNECATATPLTIQTAANCPSNATAVTSAQIAAATASSQTACYTGGQQDDDLWFAVTPTAAMGGIFISVMGSGGYDAVVQIFEGSCANADAIGCVDAGLADDTEATSLIVVPGKTYYIRVYNYDPTVGGEGFSICVSNYTDSSLACPTEVNPTAGAYCNAAVPLLTWNAIAGILAISGYNIFFGTTNPPPYIGVSTSNEVPTLTNLAPNTTYFWTVVPESATGYGACFNTVQSFTTPPAPANDLCSGAIPIGMAGGNGSVTSCNELATQSLAPINCAGTSTSAPDVWFSFTTDSDGGTASIAISGVSAGFDPVVQVLSSCTAGNLACSDAGGGGVGETVVANGLSPNTTYYVRVYGWGGSMGNFTITTSGTALPLELTTFVGKAMSSNNRIEWTTATEQNTALHTVERSADGKDSWVAIGSKAAVSNSSIIVRYNLEDNTPLAKSYYRLRTTDNDGVEHLSKIIVVERAIKDFKIYDALPNPTEASVSIRIENPTQETDVEIMTTDVAGRIISQRTYSLQVGTNVLESDMSSLAKGTYYLYVRNGEANKVMKIVKQ